MISGPASDDERLLKTSADFSLVLGGPLYQLWRGTRLAGDALQLMRRRVIAMVLLTWAPLLLLSIAEGHAWGGSVGLPFLKDVELHVRLLHGCRVDHARISCQPARTACPAVSGRNPCHVFRLDAGAFGQPRPGTHRTR